ncbi:hypothetical protein DPMN_015490 [Dreissena polymorpha]|uniref:Uncharacterized protein n=1 Tax=Dreissena polymorpha TaxID=45954 RepID=A0A9D4S4G5_DREPO|nr:hypothetical protein DPMN_015490 [Dreissena polymorpha]
MLSTDNDNERGLVRVKANPNPNPTHNSTPYPNSLTPMRITIPGLAHIIGTKFHEDRKMKNAPLPGSHVFQPTGIIFELFQAFIGMNLLTKFREDRTVNVASRVKNAPPLGSDVFQANIIIFELIQDIIETNLLTKFHEDWTINVASRSLAG